MKKAFITGITGQDGSYLAELLLSKGYEVHGMIRRSSSLNTSRIGHLISEAEITGANASDRGLYLHYGDLSDSEQISNILHKANPDEVYNLAAQSHVRVSFDTPEYTGNITGLGTTRLLEASRRINPDVKFYQASSSEMFGAAKPPQSEETCFHPRSPYACAKVYSYWMCRNYREGYGMKTSNGILFNHESPRRGETFVTRKITRAIAQILAKKEDHLSLGNLDARRDWGFSPEYVECMWMMLQQEDADDYVIGTGETHSVAEYLDAAFAYAGLDKDKYVRIDQKYFRPTEVDTLIADPRKAEKKLGWKAKVTFSDLVKIMVDSDMRIAGVEPPGEGDRIIRKKFQKKWWMGD
jgi:GDPmannose 4,6-dehydratase